MRAGGRVRVPAFLLGLALATGASRASAQDADAKKEAQTLYAQGVKLSESGDLQGALGAFRGAYEKAPNYRVLYNIGKLCGRLQDPACAVRSFAQYLAEGGSAVTAKRKTEVDKELQEAKAASGALAVTTDSGAGVTLDDQPAGRTPLAAPIPANPGAHKLVVSLEGKNVEKSVTITAGETTTVDVVIPKDPPPPKVEPTIAPPKDEPPPKPAAKKKSAVPWMVTGGLAVATVVSGVVAAVTYSSFQDKKGAFPVTRDDLDSAQGTARTFFILTGVFAALTIVSAGVAGYFTLSGPSAAPPATRASIALGPRGLLLEGTLP